MPTEIATLRVVLNDVEPAVWRRLEVPVDITFRRLHEILQAAFDWQDYHLHEFQVGKRRIGIPDPDDDIVDSARARFSTALRDGIREIVYRYDFGDGWRITITVESIAQPLENVAYPRCTDGERNSPPEDSGGPWGYTELVAAIRSGVCPRELREQLEWLHDQAIRRPFDPDRFSLKFVNMAMPAKRVRRYSKG